MEQYIDKSALLAEIKRIEHETNYEPFTDEVLGKRKACKDIKDFLDTQEVKEVDLESELNKWRHNHFHGRRDKDASGEYLERSSQLDIAKHFFELGMQAKEGNILAKAKGFLVRDKDDYTAIYSTKPERGKTEWVDGNHPRNAKESSCLFTMDARLLPDIEFDDEPMEVEVIIKKKEK